MHDKALNVSAWEAHWISAHLAFMGKSFPPYPPPPITHTQFTFKALQPCDNIEEAHRKQPQVTCTNLSLRLTFNLPHVYLQNKRTMVHRITKSLKPLSNVKLHMC